MGGRAYSLKAGSTGLNLTCCSRVILLDLWWNPAIEWQAFDRVHRFGQRENVNVYKITIEHTIEDRVLKLQNDKAELAKAALSEDGGSLKNQKVRTTPLYCSHRTLTRSLCAAHVARYDVLVQGRRRR